MEGRDLGSMIRGAAERLEPWSAVVAAVALVLLVVGLVSATPQARGAVP